jgi:hypothetical protein
LSYSFRIIQSKTSVEEKWTELKNGINNTLGLNVPKKLTPNRHNLPWLSNKDKKMIRKKHQLFQRAKQIERTEDWDKYRLQKRAMQKAVRQAHWSYVNNVDFSSFRFVVSGFEICVYNDHIVVRYTWDCVAGFY